MGLLAYAPKGLGYRSLSKHNSFLLLALPGL
jgi:hypothetical protein